MKILLMGATGMVGQGVLRECLRDPDVTEVVAPVRSSTGHQHPKLRELIHQDFFDLTALEPELTDLDACFFCLGVSASGLKEADYTRITFDLTMKVAEALLRLRPQATFIYVSGMGTDSTEKGRWMWARVKGRTENTLLRRFANAYMFRPGFIQPLHGIKSKTPLYRAIYTATGPLLPLFRKVAPSSVITTEDVGRSMLQVAKHGADKRVLENADLAELARAST